jgi:hypothetical protein
VDVTSCECGVVVWKPTFLQECHVSTVDGSRGYE